MANMAPRPHKDTCRSRMESHLEKEENPRWKRPADAKEGKFWEARQEEEDEMAKDKVDESKIEETTVDEPKVEEEGEHPSVTTEKVVEKRSAEDTGGTGSSNDQTTDCLKKPKFENKQGEKRPGDENVQSTRRVRFEEKHSEKRAGEETNQPTRKTKVVEPQGEKRKEMETDFEENIRSLQSQAHNLGLKTMDVLDIRGWKESESTMEKMAQKIRQEKPMLVIGGMRKLVQQATKPAEVLRN